MPSFSLSSSGSTLEFICIATQWEPSPSSPQDLLLYTQQGRVRCVKRGEARTWPYWAGKEFKVFLLGEQGTITEWVSSQTPLAPHPQWMGTGGLGGRWPQRGLEPRVAPPCSDRAERGEAVAVGHRGFVWGWRAVCFSPFPRWGASKF